MDTEVQPAAMSPQPTNKAPSKTHHLAFGLLSLMILIVGMGAVYFWQHQQVKQLNSKLDNYQSILVKDSQISLDRLDALMAIPNIIVDSANSPPDLIAFLGADNTQCYKNNGTGYYKVMAQASDQFAKMQYGCTAKDGTSPSGNSPSFILAKKTNDKWNLIIPTNQWQPVNGQDEPSCSMVNENKVSKLVTPQCWQGPALGSLNETNNQQKTVVSVTNP